MKDAGITPTMEMKMLNRLEQYKRISGRVLTEDEKSLFRSGFVYGRVDSMIEIATRTGGKVSDEGRKES